MQKKMLVSWTTLMLAYFNQNMSLRVKMQAVYQEKIITSQKSNEQLISDFLKLIEVNKKITQLFKQIRDLHTTSPKRLSK